METNNDQNMDVGNNVTIVCRPIDGNGSKIKDPASKVKKIFKRPHLKQEDLSLVQGLILSLLIILLIVIGYLYFKNYIVSFSSIAENTNNLNRNVVGANNELMGNNGLGVNNELMGNNGLGAINGATATANANANGATANANGAAANGSGSL